MDAAKRLGLESVARRLEEEIGPEGPRTKIKRSGLKALLQEGLLRSRAVRLD